MRIALIVLMAVHGIAHLPGFVVPWRLASLDAMPYGTTLLGGHLDVGAAGARAIGVLWLLAAVSFWTASAGAALDAGWWVPLAAAAAAASLVLCGLGWPYARLGVPVNAVVLVLLVFRERLIAP
jgi:hypothetical protein